MVQSLVQGSATLGPFVDKMWFYIFCNLPDTHLVSKTQCFRHCRLALLVQEVPTCSVVSKYLKHVALQGWQKNLERALTVIPSLIYQSTITNICSPLHPTLY